MSHSKQPATPSPGDVPLEAYRDLDIRASRILPILRLGARQDRVLLQTKGR